MAAKTVKTTTAKPATSKGFLEFRVGIKVVKEKLVKANLRKGVYEASLDYFNGQDKVAAAVAAIGVAGPQQARLEFCAAYMTHRYQKDLKKPLSREDALALLDLKGFNPKKPTANNARTSEQEKWYGAARVQWSTILAAAGIKTADNRGGNRKGKANADKAKGKAKGEAPAAAPQQTHIPATGAAKMPARTREAVVTWAKSEAQFLVTQQKSYAKVCPAVLATALVEAAKLIEAALKECDNNAQKS